MIMADLDSDLLHGSDEEMEEALTAAEVLQKLEEVTSLSQLSR